MRMAQRKLCPHVQFACKGWMPAGGQAPSAGLYRCQMPAGRRALLDVPFYNAGMRQSGRPAWAVQGCGGQGLPDLRHGLWPLHEEKLNRLLCIGLGD